MGKDDRLLYQNKSLAATVDIKVMAEVVHRVERTTVLAGAGTARNVGYRGSGCMEGNGLVSVESDCREYPQIDRTAEYSVSCFITPGSKLNPNCYRRHEAFGAA